MLDSIRARMSGFAPQRDEGHFSVAQKAKNFMKGSKDLTVKTAQKVGKKVMKEEKKVIDSAKPVVTSAVKMGKKGAKGLVNAMNAALNFKL